MKDFKLSKLSVSIICLFVLMLFCCVACSKTHNYVNEITLGDGLPNVKMNGDYYKVTVPYALKDDGATDFYRTDGDEPYVIVYKFNWATEDGNWNSMDEYFEHEAKKYDSTTHKASWEEAGFPDCKSYIKIETFNNDLYITTCYAIQNGQECVEVYYLDKISEVKINDANVKFVVPKLNEIVEISEEQAAEGMVDNRVSHNSFFPSIGFYLNYLDKSIADGIHSDLYIQFLTNTEQDKDIVKTTINGYKALTGKRVDEKYGPSNFVIYEIGDHVVSIYYTASNEEMAAHGENISRTIQYLS